jgi:hypothetical protein
VLQHLNKRKSDSRDFCGSQKGQDIHSYPLNGGRPSQHGKNECVFREITNDIDNRQQPPNPGGNTRKRYWPPDRSGQRRASDRQETTQKEQVQHVKRDNACRVSFREITVLSDPVSQRYCVERLSRCRLERNGVSWAPSRVGRSRKRLDTALPKEIAAAEMMNGSAIANLPSRIISLIGLPP